MKLDMSGERVLLVILYILLLSMLGFTFFFQNLTYSTFVIAVVTIVVVVEMLYIFILYPNKSLCRISKDMWCKEQWAPPARTHPMRSKHSALQRIIAQ